MHVCLLTAGRPSEVIVGGEERFTISLGKWLLSQGHKVTIVSRKLFGVEVVEEPCDISTPNSYDKKNTIRRLQLPYPVFILAMLSTSMLLALSIISLNRKLKISIIHAQDTGYGGLAAIVAAKLLRIPVVLSSHGVRYYTVGNALKGSAAALCLPWEYWLDLFTSRFANIVVNVSSVGEKFFSVAIKKNKMRTIPIGIETSDFRADEEVGQTVRKNLGIQDDVLLGFVGRLAPEKNLFTLLDAFLEASNQAKKMKLLIVGTGPLESKLKSFSHDRGLDGKVVFTGVRSDVNRLLAALDIFLLPSFTEGCPTSLLEAMASENAIIASDIPSIREIVSSDNEAILVNPHDAEELEQAILKLYSNPKRRKELGRKAKNRAKQYDINIVNNEILELYKNLVAPRQISPRKKDSFS